MFLADSSGGSAAIAIVVWIVLIGVYWSPTIMGAISKKHNLGVIAAWNFFGFFLFFPWIVAWVKVAEKPQQPTVIMYPGPGYQPPQGPYPQYGVERGPDGNLTFTDKPQGYQ